MLARRACIGLFLVMSAGSAPAGQVITHKNAIPNSSMGRATVLMAISRRTRAVAASYGRTFALERMELQLPR